MYLGDGSRYDAEGLLRLSRDGPRKSNSPVRLAAREVLRARVYDPIEAVLSFSISMRLFPVSGTVCVIDLCKEKSGKLYNDTLFL